MYAEYKPNVPNPGKMEDNMIHDIKAIQDLNEKKTILKDIRGPLS
jgi:hypothetical protein